MLRAALDAEDAIDAATFSGDVEASKPAPDLVEVALGKASLLAKAAGWS
jgi:beta-phosphoglucomutase-like phosphatase (HAD superfamily)